MLGIFDDLGRANECAREHVLALEGLVKGMGEGMEGVEGDEGMVGLGMEGLGPRTPPGQVRRDAWWAAAGVGGGEWAFLGDGALRDGGGGVDGDLADAEHETIDDDEYEQDGEPSEADDDDNDDGVNEETKQIEADLATFIPGTWHITYTETQPDGCEKILVRWGMPGKVTKVVVEKREVLGKGEEWEYFVPLFKPNF